jgi:hypothetical protein
MSIKEILEQTETLIRENIVQYREQFKKEILSFSDLLKREYEAIKVNAYSMMEGLVDRFEKNLKDKEKESREQILKDLKIYVEEAKSTFKESISSLTIKQNGLETKLQNLENKVYKESREISDRLDILKSSKFEGLEQQIKLYIENNKKEIAKLLVYSFFRKKK